MEKLPNELQTNVFSFVPKEWLKLCARDYFYYFLDKYPIYNLLIQWVHYKKLEEKNRKKASLISLEILSMREIKPIFRNFKDVDRHFIRKSELEGEKEHFSRLVQVYNKKSMFLMKKLKPYYSPSRLEFLYQQKK
jgi:hypothetical protein